MNAQRKQPLIFSDGVMHRPFNWDNNGVVIVCEYSDEYIEHKNLRRFPCTALVASERVTCISCLAADDGYFAHFGNLADLFLLEGVKSE